MKEKKLGRPRKYDYEKIVKAYKKYGTKWRVSIELDVPRKIVYRALYGYKSGVNSKVDKSFDTGKK